MIKWIGNLYRASAPVRFIYNLISIVSIIFTVGSLIYYGFFDHREWTTKRVAAQYEAVEDQQLKVADLILSTVPSNANDDRVPSKEEVQALRRALLNLSGTITQVDNVSENMIEASDVYRASISALAGALVHYDPSEPVTQAQLHQAVDLWDRAARTYANAVEGHIGSFTRTLPSSV